MASTAHADAQTMGDDAAADAADIEVPEYDEDETEAFHGPELRRGVELEEDEDFRDGESGSIEAMESQWAESGYTQLGAVPGSQTRAKTVVRTLSRDPLSESGELPGGGTYEPGKPPQFNAEFLASGEEEAGAPQLARTVDALDPKAMFNPDGSPHG